MLNNGNKINCEFMDGVVSYLYDEIEAAERTQFEKHLANCTACTDEFATISNARFSVCEWHREEFAPLSTPEVVIPYKAKNAKIQKAVSAGMAAGFRGWLSFVNFPIAAAAGLLVLFGLGLVAFRFLDGGEQTIASNIKSASTVKTAPTQQSVGAPDSKQKEVAIETVPRVVAPSKREIRPITVVEHRKTIIKRQLTASNSVDRKAVQNIPDAPVLSENYEESQDASLRLSDLFADDDG